MLDRFQGLKSPDPSRILLTFLIIAMLRAVTCRWRGSLAGADCDVFSPELCEDGTGEEDCLQLCVPLWSTSPRLGVQLSLQASTC